MHPLHAQTIVIIAAMLGNGQLTTTQVGDKVAQLGEQVQELREDQREQERRVAALERAQ